MKYKEIYKAIRGSGSTTIDRSGWHKYNPSIVDHWRPLWIVLENQKANVRMWVTHEHRQLKITTAQLDLDPDSKEYYDSQVVYQFRTQADMAKKLREILCVNEQELDKRIDS